MVLYLVCLKKLPPMLSESFEKIIASEKPVLIDFYATWCGPCKMMPPILDQVRSKLGDQVRIIKIDVDKNKDLADALRIKALPTFIIYKSGEMKWRQSGEQDANTLIGLIQEYA